MSSLSVLIGTIIISMTIYACVPGCGNETASFSGFKSSPEVGIVSDGGTIDNVVVLAVAEQDVGQFASNTIVLGVGFEYRKIAVAKEYLSKLALAVSPVKNANALSCPDPELVNIPTDIFVSLQSLDGGEEPVLIKGFYKYLLYGDTELSAIDELPNFLISNPYSDFFLELDFSSIENLSSESTLVVTTV